jgi:ribosomal protein S18 acetylase RimI-like enzyme
MPMKGQHLFVRTIEAADHDAIRAFLEAEGNKAVVPACGLLGKLVGDLVAILAMRITADAVEIDDLVVARDFRRKRIGRVMLAELEQIAQKMDRPQLLVREAEEGSAEFLRRVGFEREGPRWIRKVAP